MGSLNPNWGTLLYVRCSQSRGRFQETGRVWAPWDLGGLLHLLEKTHRTHGVRQTRL